MLRNFTKTLGAAGIALIALAGQASAGDLFGRTEGSIKDDPAPAAARTFSYSVNAGVTSDYMFRGLSLSNGDPAVFAGLDATYGIFYAGIWGTSLSNLDWSPANYGHTEIDLYAGIKPVLGPVTFDFGVIYYLYPSDSVSFDYVELKAGGSITPVTNLTLGTTFYFAPDQQGAPETFTVEGNAAYTFRAIGRVTPTLSGVLGWSEASGIDSPNVYGVYNDESYMYWNVGLGLAFDKFTLDLRYWDTDGVGRGSFFDSSEFANGDNADSRFVASIKVVLP